MICRYFRSIGLWKTLSLALSLTSILFLAADHYGFSDWWLGISTLRSVSARFNRNLGDDASLPIYRGDGEWDLVTSLIETYSNVEIPPGKVPETLARERTALSAKQGDNEWTVPITRLVLFFYHWPQNTEGSLKLNQDYVIVGTIGDFQNWITQKQTDFRFKIKDLILGIMVFVLAILSAAPEKR